MIPSRRIIFLPLSAFAISIWFSGALYSQVPSAPAAPSTKIAPANPGQFQPPLPVLKSPVDILRALMAMKPEERERFLASRPSEIRTRFMAKVQEYEAMKPEERELRLRATQLRWYLLPLMQTPPTNRVAQLATIPEADRQLVSDRLKQWDNLPSGIQKEFLEYGLTASYFVPGSDRPDAIPKSSLEKMLPPDLVTRINYVSMLPPDQRRQMYDNFQHFFELTDQEKQKTLEVLSPAERRQMLKALQTFLRLPKSRRDECLQSFGKFASMTTEERTAFFKNAERWKELSPAERQAWRNLVNRFPAPPPLPTHAGSQHLPPLPPNSTVVPRPGGVPVATNVSP